MCYSIAMISRTVKATLFWGLIASLSLSFSQTNYGDLFFSGISAEDGLSNDSIYCLLQDSRGFMWVGTFGGLDRYDGNDFVSFKPGGSAGTSISGSVVFALAEGKSGEIWVGTDGGGLNRLDPETGRIDQFREKAPAGSGPGSDLIYALAAERSGNLWVGTGGAGLAEWQNKDGRFRRFTAENSPLSSNIVRALLHDRQGRLWIGTTNGGVLVMEHPDDDPASMTRIELPSAGLNATVRSLCEDSGGNIWVGTEGNGLFRIDWPRPPSKKILTARIPMPQDQGGDHATIRAIEMDEDGRLWIGTEGSGLAIFESDGKLNSQIRGNNIVPGELGGDLIRSIIRDRTGMMWIGMKDGGISIGNPGAVAFGIQKADGNSGLPRGTVRSFTEDGGGNLWIASDGGGLVRYDFKSKRYETYGPQSGLTSSRLCSVLEDSKGNLYVGTDGSGLFRFDPRTRRATEVALGLGKDSGIASEGGPVVWALYEDTGKNLWVGLEASALVELKADGSRKRYPYAPDSTQGLGGRSVRCIEEDADGSILVGTWDGGLQRIDPAAETVEQFPSQDGTDTATSDVSIYCVVRDSKNRVWIGTGSGLDRYERESGKTRIVPVELGFLPRRPSIFGIVEDTSGSLWLSTEIGLLRYDPQSKDLRRWTRSDGLQDDHFAPGAFLRLKDGHLAFGGTKGFNLFDPKSLQDRAEPPAVRIVSIIPLDTTGPEERSGIIPSSKKPIRVPYSASAFALTLAVLDYTDPGKNLFALKIEGKQNQRYYLGSSNHAIVPRLAPGSYRFIASGAGNRGVWNENGSSILVEVVPPFWTSPIGIGSFAVAGALLIFSAFKLRVARLERRTRELRDLSAHIHDAREEERAEIAREVHDQLGQTLTALKIGLYWAKNNARLATQTMEEKLRELLEYTDLALDSVKSISTRLRPSVLDTLSLAEALEWLVNDFRRWSGVECESLFDPTPRDLDHKTKTTTFRVLQENLTNIARHSKASKADIRLSVTPDWITLTVRDNGTGIDPEVRDAQTSFGIAGMRERCSYLGGSFEVFPSPQGGTMMIARLPNLRKREEKDA